MARISSWTGDLLVILITVPDGPRVKTVAQAWWSNSITCPAVTFPLSRTSHRSSPRSFTKTSSILPPPGHLRPVNRTAATFVSFTTTTSPGASKVGRSATR